MGCLGPFITAVFNCGNKNLGAFATFLRLGTPFRLRKAETGYREADYLRFYAADLCFGTLRQSLIANKLQSKPIYCFLASEVAMKRRGAVMRGVGSRIGKKTML